MTGGRSCYICGRTLSDDPKLVHLAVDAERMEALGVLDLSELRAEHAVIVELCDVCGTREGAPTVQQIRNSEPIQ